MQRSIQTFIFLFSIILLIQCKDETYYERPKWLEPPIYQQLQARGNFTQYLAIVDKVGFKKTLDGAGYFTVFAPNDDAVQRFLGENGYESINDVDSVTLRSIVSYSLVYNRFERNRLADYQGSTGWVPLNAFKRRTAYYRGVHPETINNNQYLVMSSNRNGFSIGIPDGGYILDDFNNKYIPYFLNEYLSEKGLSSYDYNFFYPQTTFTGFNVTDASVIAEDINAENGIIHEIDKVILPVPSIDEYLEARPEYSEFRKLLSTRDTLFLHPTITKYYQALSQSSDPVYVKYFTNAIAFSPNNESFLRSSGNDAQSDGWSIVVPTNDVLTNYINTVLLDQSLPPTDRYQSLDQMPRSVLDDFLNAHMYQITLWPSKFKTTSNILGEAPTLDANSNIVDGKVLSNGMFYGTNKVHEANVFHSVFGKAYLNRKYSVMTAFLQRELKSTLINQFSKYAVFLISNDAMTAAGYGQNPSTLEWYYEATPGGARTTGGAAVDRLNRLMNMHIVRLSATGDQLTSFSGEGVVQTLGGEYVKYKNGALYAAGNLEVITPASILTETAAPKAVTSDLRTANNGKTYAIDKVLKFPELTLGRYIAAQGDVAGKPYFEFYQYLRQSTLWTAASFDIAGVSLGAFHTVFIPTNAAIVAARSSGKLPAANTTNAAQRTQIANFLLYHFMVKSTIVPDGDPNTPGSQETLLNKAGLPVQLGVINNKNDLRILDNAYYTNPTTVQPAKVIIGTASNQLAQRAVIHQIDRVLDAGN